LMLYSVRDACDADLEGVLRQTAEIGYEGVELHSLHGHPAERVRGWLDEHGLVAIARHSLLGPLEDDLPGLIAELRAIGARRLVLAWIEPPANAHEAGAKLERLAAVAATAKATAPDIAIGFHNHDGELLVLDDGRSFLDRALGLDIFLELDLGWIWWAGHDGAALLDSTRGRVPIVHVKDFRARGEHRFCAVGEGAVDFDRSVPAAEAAGVEWLVVEQDENTDEAGGPGDALGNALRSFDALQALRRRA